MAKDTDSCHGCLDGCFDYETPKTIVIRSKTVGLLFRFIQFLIVIYVFGYVCAVQKGYQDTDSVISSVTTKIKGYAFTNTPDLGPRVWDVADYVIPPQGEKSFFVLTNFIVTPNQTQSRCPELPTTSNCIEDSDCTKGLSDGRSNGIQTGQCVKYSHTIKTCEVQSWCPLELDGHLPDHALLAAAEDFTVLIKNSVRYPRFNFHRRNILPNVTTSYLKQCEFDRDTHPYCPIFRLKTMISEAGEDFQTMAIKGGILGIFIDWTCELDWEGWLKPCYPQYTFRRLDNKNPENNVAPGYNFRFAKYYKNSDGTESRTLIKGYGIRFDVIVFGTAGRFSIAPTIVNLGAALAFLSLVGAVCDWFMLTCTKRRDYYNKHRTTYLDEDDTTNSQMSLGTAYGTQ